MKSNQLLAALTGVFVLCSAVTFYKAWSYHASLHRLGETEGQAAYLKSVRGPMLQALLSDTTEYSKKDAAVLPILQALTNGMSKRIVTMPKPGTK
jgi:hypothetical protein